jgi:hypothetical protein
LSPSTSLTTAAQNTESLPDAFEVAYEVMDVSDDRSNVSVRRPCSPAIFETAMSIAGLIVVRSIRISAYRAIAAWFRKVGSAELHADRRAYDIS